MRGRALAVLLVLAASPALAQETEGALYRDDRSTPNALIESFYNAINRVEYARAYSYFADDAEIAPFEEWKAGYESTFWVDVLTGEPSADGAMSKVYYALPVALDAESPGGEHKQFAGCYLLRLTSSEVQDPPVTPMQIIKGKLKPAKGDLADILPASCDIDSLF